MIYGKLECGLGNQMFQYAFFRVLQHHYGEKAMIDISSGSAFGQYHARKPVFLLSDFRLDLKDVTFEADASRMAKAAGWRWNFVKGLEFFLKAVAKVLDAKDLFHWMQSGLQPGLNRLGIYNMQYGPAPLRFDAKTPDVIFYGNFLSPSFFDEIGPELKECFQVITPLNADNQRYLEKILNTESVCVHVRRGDFTVKRYKMLNVCTPLYYQTAIDLLLEKKKDLHFFVFSNDMEWARENLDFGDSEVDFVDVNSSQQPVEDLRLMMNCKHFIIANSSFSWWAQYLGSAPDKIVVAPKYFRTPKRYNDIVSSSYRQENWILVDNSAEE